MVQNKPPRFIAELETVQGHACFSVHVSVRAAADAPEDTMSTHLLPAGDPQRAILTEAISALRQTPEGARVELRTNSDYLTDGILRWRSGWERRNFQTAKGRPVALADVWKTLFAEVDARQVRAVLSTSTTKSNTDSHVDCRATGGAQIVVTDSPCLLSCAYQTSPGIEAAALEAHFAYPSLNLFVDHSERYSAYGRVHERDQAEQIDERIIGILNRFSIPFTRVSIEHGEQQAVAMVLEQARRAAEVIGAEPLSSFDQDNSPLPC